MLGAEEIKKLVASGEIIISPFDENLLKPASYTFSLGNGLWRLKSAESLDTRVKRQDFEELSMDSQGYLLRPGEFIICHTNEVLELGKTIGCFLTMRGAMAQTGLDALGGEIFCEPGSRGGWYGRLMLETTNRGSCPIKIFPGIKIVKGVFVRLQ